MSYWQCLFQSICYYFTECIEKMEAFEYHVSMYCMWSTQYFLFRVLTGITSVYISLLNFCHTGVSEVFLHGKRVLRGTHRTKIHDIGVYSFTEGGPITAKL